MKIAAKSKFQTQFWKFDKAQKILTDFETTRERALSPNMVYLQKWTGRLPLLQLSKKRIGILSWIKREKSLKVNNDIDKIRKDWLIVNN